MKLAVDPAMGITRASTPHFKLSKQNSFTIQFVGEILEYSYIKMNLESTEYSRPYKNRTTQLKGSYYEAKTSSTFKVIGTYNPETYVWKLDCFDKNNILTAVFLGKAKKDGSLEGTWTSRSTVHKFYLKRSHPH